MLLAYDLYKSHIRDHYDKHKKEERLSQDG